MCAPSAVFKVTVKLTEFHVKLHVKLNEFLNKITCKINRYESFFIYLGVKKLISLLNMI